MSNKIFYSPSSRGFYDTWVHTEAQIPVDRVEIPASLHAALLEAQSGGKEIVAGPDGVPVAIDPPAVPLTAAIQRALLHIDAETDRVIRDTIGSRAEEYRQAEADATAYRDAGYGGTVPPFVADHQAAKGDWTAQQAADDILSTSAAWRTAQAAIRANRLLCKEHVRRAADLAGVQTGVQQWAAFVVAVRGQLGIGA